MSPTREELLALRRKAAGEDPVEEPEAPKIPDGFQAIGLVVGQQFVQLDAAMTIDLEGQANGAPVALVHNGDGTWTALVIPPGHKWELRPSGPVKTLWLPQGSQ